MRSLQYSTRHDSNSSVEIDSEATGEFDPWQTEIDWKPKSKQRIDKSVIKLINLNVNLMQLINSLGIDLEEVYSPSGWTMKGCCPFPTHSDSTPSFGVNVEENRFFCFGCQKGGGVVQFFSNYRSISIFESAEYFISNNGYYLDNEIENLEYISDEKVFEALFDYSNIINNFIKNNNDLKSIKFVEDLNWSLDMYLQKNIPTKSISLENLSARIEILLKKLKEYEKQNNNNR